MLFHRQMRQTILARTLAETSEGTL